MRHMTLWEIGKYREGWVHANTDTSKKEGGGSGGQKEFFSEEEFEAAMAATYTETEETGTIDDFLGNKP